MLDILFEDDSILVLVKPSGVLSQPGKDTDGSIATQLRSYCVNYTGPMLVHRLDMDTSGLMVFAKTKAAHLSLQQQFERRLIRKRYCAVLETELEALGGRVNLPLKLDYPNRPRQVVCFQSGKLSSTVWTKMPNSPQRVWFYPLSGRTHQLRVVASSVEGLCSPILGDRLYGDETSAHRLMLHADRLGFSHPVTNKHLEFVSAVPF